MTFDVVDFGVLELEPRGECEACDLVLLDLNDRKEVFGLQKFFVGLVTESDFVLGRSSGCGFGICLWDRRRIS